MEATPLTAEQKAVLSTAFHYIQSITIYLKLKAVIPVVRETDAMLLELWAANGSSLLELGDVCLRRLPLFFPELRPLAEEHKKRDCSHLGRRCLRPPRGAGGLRRTVPRGP